MPKTLTIAEILSKRPCPRARAWLEKHYAIPTTDGELVWQDIDMLDVWRHPTKYVEKDGFEATWVGWLAHWLFVGTESHQLFVDLRGPVDFQNDRIFDVLTKDLQAERERLDTEIRIIRRMECNTAAEVEEFNREWEKLHSERKVILRKVDAINKSLLLPRTVAMVWVFATVYLRMPE